MNLCNDIAQQVSSAALYAWWQVLVAGISALGCGIVLGFADHLRAGAQGTSIVWFHTIVGAGLFGLSYHLAFDSQAAIALAWASVSAVAAGIIVIREIFRILRAILWFIRMLLTNPAALRSHIRDWLKAQVAAFKANWHAVYAWTESPKQQKSK